MRRAAEDIQRAIEANDAEHRAKKERAIAAHRSAYPEIAEENNILPMRGRADRMTPGRVNS